MPDKVVFNDYDVTVEIYDAVIAKWVLTDYLELDSTSTSYLRNRDQIQPLLTPGKNIKISKENVISAEIPPDELKNFISADSSNELELGTDGLFYISFSGLLRDCGVVDTRDDLPESAGNFVAYYIKDEDAWVFAFNSGDAEAGDPVVLEWRSLDFYVDMNLYVSKEELAPLLDEKVDKTQLSVNPMPDTVPLRTPDGRVKTSAATDSNDSVNLGQLNEHNADETAHPFILKKISDLSDVVDTKVAKVPDANVVYTNDQNGDPSSTPYSTDAVANTIAQRNSSGSVTVPVPQVGSDATPMSYVDEQDSDLRTSISKNASDISSLGTRMGTAEQNISSLGTRMGTAEQDISSLTGRVTTNEQDISSLKDQTSGNDADIASLQKRMGTAETDIDNLEGRMSAAETDIGKRALQTALDAEVSRATAAENLKLDKSSINENYVLSAVFSVEGSTGVQTLQITFKNPVTGATSTVARTIQLASETVDGFMAHQDKLTLADLVERVGMLEGEQRRYLYDGSANPTADQINTYAQSLGFSAPFTGILIVVKDTNHIWSYYEGGTGWRDNGTDTVMQATTTLLGIVLSSTDTGKVYVEADGTMSVVGWDSVIADIANLDTSKVDSVTLSGGTNNGTVKLTVVTGGVSSVVDNIPVTGLGTAAFHPEAYFATATQVSKNTQDISALTTRMGAAEQDLSSVTDRVETAEQDISTLKSSVNSLNGDNTTNKQNISNLQTRMSAAEKDIDDLQGAVGDSAADLSALTERVSANENSINNLSAVKANLESPAFTGTPTAPTPATTDNSTRIATTNFVNLLLSSVRPYGTTVPLMDGDTASVGTAAGLARIDHVHPHDTTRVPITRTVNGKALSADIVLTAADVLAAPILHAVATAATYGGGTSALYGHVKLSDSVSLDSGADSSIAATPSAVKAVNDALTQEVSNRVTAVSDALSAANDYTDSKVQQVSSVTTLPSNWATFNSELVSNVFAQAQGKQQLLVQFTPVVNIEPDNSPITVFSDILADVRPSLKLRFGSVWDYEKLEEVGFCVIDQDGDLSINAVSPLSAGTEYTVIV